MRPSLQIQEALCKAASRLNTRVACDANMSLAHKLLRALDHVRPAPVAYAHCDIPCGIYDPHHAQLAAHTVIRMVDLIGQLEKPGPNATPSSDRSTITSSLGIF